ncbi:hypothetical protein ABT009_45440 [Streptomyces sp. NPDC002896]|uniref:hypothetical protein n=1 Tax=Streptomyces sp. NPDC002896 TaxID=3154438 RepID=UPI00332EA9C4
MTPFKQEERPRVHRPHPDCRRSGVGRVVATWVVADETALADGLATALFFTEAQRLAETFQFAYVRMYADGRAEHSPDFVGEPFN